MHRPFLKPLILAVLATLVPAAPAEEKGPPAGRAFHFAGGRMKSAVKLGDKYSVSFWLWNALPDGARPVTGYAFSRGVNGDSMDGEHLGIGGTYKAEAQGRLILFNGNRADQLLSGKTRLVRQAWHHVVLVRDGAKVRLYLDGNAEPDLAGELPVVIRSEDVFVGGRADNLFNWEGKLDEVAIFDRALTADEATGLYMASGLKPPAPVPDTPPLSPEEALKSIHVPDGFKVELAACEPNVVDPVAIDWDLAGRMWVVEMADYPSGMDGKGKAGGRVRVLEDTDGDGKYEKSTLFAEGLNFPNGLLTWRDGVIVTAAPDVLFLKDTDGDGRADRTEKLITGLSEGNQQLRANGLRWGLDNRVYCAAGGHHGGHAANTVLHSHRDGKDVPVGSRDFSFDPDSGDVEAESGPSQFGRNRDDAGHWFGTQNSRALWQYVLPDRYLKRNPFVPAPDPTHLIVTPLNAPVFPVSSAEKRYHSFENAGHFTSACGGMIYCDDLLFPRRADEMDAFTCEPFHNLVQHNVLVEDGVSYRAKRAAGEEKHDFFASTDRWCRPVMTRTGPDGALWVVDMYRYIIEHPDWLPEKGRAELMPYYRMGDDRGRIYRVSRINNPPRRVQPLQKLDARQLVAALDSPNGWQRDKVQMALRWQWKGRPAADFWQEHRIGIATLRASALPAARAQTYWLLHGLYGLPEGAAEALLDDSSPLVREQAAVMVRPGELHRDVAGKWLGLANDANARVRLRLALEIGQWTKEPDAPELKELYLKCGRVLAQIAVRDAASPWIHAAVISSAVPHCRGLCEGIAAAGGASLASYADDLAALALGLDDRDSLAAMLTPLLAVEDGHYEATVESLARLLAALEKKGVNRTALTGKPDALTTVVQRMDSVFSQAAKVLAAETSAAGMRATSALLLIHDKPGRQKVLETVPNWLSPASDPALQLAAVRVLAASGEARVPEWLLHDIASLTPQTRGAVLDALLSREAWALALLDHIQANPSLTMDAVQRARFTQHGSAKVRERAAAVIKADSSRKDVIEAFRPALALKGDAARGKVVFARCIGCHRMDGQGIEIGPDLKSVINHPAEKLLTNIVDPSLDVQPGYFAFNARLKDGSVLYGLITSETGNSITFKLTDGTTLLVLRSDLAELKSTGQSLMPAGLETGMTVQEMADLIAWLKQSR